MKTKTGNCIEIDYFVRKECQLDLILAPLLAPLLFSTDKIQGIKKA
jgi:hypothetical protein